MEVETFHAIGEGRDEWEERLLVDFPSTAWNQFFFGFELVHLGNGKEKKTTAADTAADPEAEAPEADEPEADEPEADDPEAEAPEAEAPEADEPASMKHLAVVLTFVGSGALNFAKQIKSKVNGENILMKDSAVNRIETFSKSTKPSSTSEIVKLVDRVELRIGILNNNYIKSALGFPTNARVRPDFASMTLTSEIAENVAKMVLAQHRSQIFVHRKLDMVHEHDVAGKVFYYRADVYMRERTVHDDYP